MRKQQEMRFFSLEEVVTSSERLLQGMDFSWLMEGSGSRPIVVQKGHASMIDLVLLAVG